MKRRLTGILAAIGLAAIIIGLPALLIATHNVAAPHFGWTPNGLWQALLAPDDGTLLATLVKLVGWISWAILTTTIGIEIISRVRHLPVPQLPGLAWPQLLARGLISAILAGFIATNTLNTAAEPATAHQTGAAAAPLVATAPLQAPAKPPKNAETYTVKRGDTLSEIALDELGDGHAYPRIYKASKTTVQPDGRRLTDPDLIIPGWKLTIPNPHTTRDDTPATKADSGNGDHDHPAATPAPASPQPTVATAPPTSEATVPPAKEATPSVAASYRVEPAPVPANADDDWLAPPWQVAGLVGAGGLLAGALWLMLQRRRRAQFRARRPGRTITVPAAGYAPIEKTLAHSGAPTSEVITAIDDGLRRLATALQSSGQPIPTLRMLKVTTDTLTARFAEPVTLPDPWHPSAEASEWRAECRTLDQGEPLDPDSSPPWPQLATIGMDEGGTWHLLNLEALGVITLSGDPDYTTDLARYLAGELAVVPWARDLRIDCVGTCRELAALNPARVHHQDQAGAVADTVAAAVKVHDRLTAANIEHLEDARLAHADDRLWDSRILVTTPDTADLPVLTDLINAQPGRTATSVLVLGADANPDTGGVQVQVDTDGRVRIPALGLDLIANGLTPSEAIGCAAVLAAADSLDDIPNPVPEEPVQAWEKLCDETGQLRPELALPRNAEPDGDASSLMPGSDEHWVSTTANTPQDLASIAPLVPAETRRTAEAADPALDNDLAAWATDSCDRPRLSVLGPMRLRVGPGGDPVVVAKRTPYYTNMVAYLAATRGATTDQVATAMGLSSRRVHKDMSVVRDWLGINPHTGDHYLPDAARNREAAKRGVGIYLVEDLLEDADLFRRLRLRGEARGAEGLPDLLAALRLVVGAPYEDQRRQGRPWLTDTRPDRYLQCAIVDVAHLVTSIALEADDIRQARAAAELAMLAAPDQHTPALDLAAVAAKQGRDDEAAALARSVVDWTDGSGEPPIELPERADRILRTHRWLEPKEQAS
jgi:hypothetical protein